MAKSEDNLSNNRRIIQIIRRCKMYVLPISLQFAFSNFAESQIKITNSDIYTINYKVNTSIIRDTSLNETLKIIPKIDSLVNYLKLSTSENNLDYFNEIPSIFPLKIRIQKLHISSNFSRRIHPISKKIAFHNGIDFPANKGSLVFATANGIIIKIYRNSNNGIGFGIKLKHQYGYESLYGHLLKLPKLQVGDSVSRGQIIGFVGNTGISTGYHLHYTIYYKKKAVNPLIYCKLLEKL